MSTATVVQTQRTNIGGVGSIQNRFAHGHNRRVGLSAVDHDHFICEKCHQLIEFRNEAISELLEKVAMKMGFRMTSHRLEAHGICAECAKPPTRQHRKLDMI